MPSSHMQRTSALLRRSALGGASMPFAEPGVTPHYGPSWTFRILDAHVQLRFEPSKGHWQGRSRFRVEALPGFRGSYSFDLEGVAVRGVVDGEGRDLEHVTAERRVIIKASAEVGEIEIRYGGESAPPAGLYFTGPTELRPDRQHMAWTQCQDEDAHFFMPCLDHPRVKHRWTIELEGPVGHTLLSNGALVESGERDGRAFAIWRQSEPMPVYLFTAVAAQLSVTETHWRDLSVRYLVPVGEEENVQRSFGRTPEMMEHFSQVVGYDCPWSRYYQVFVHDFVCGGMENVAATTMTDLLLVDDRVGPHWDPDGLVCHELAHQWFGDLVTCQDWSQAWLNESWATFMETIWWDHARAADEAEWYAYKQFQGYLREDSGRYRRAIASYLFREPIDLFDHHLYEKGSVVLRTLRAELGEQAFWAGAKSYLERNAHGTVHGRSFQTAMEDATGVNLDLFFHQWILSAGHPEIEVEIEDEEDRVLITVKQTQTGEDTPEVFQLNLALELVHRDGLVTPVTLPVRERERTWVVPSGAELKAVRVDPGFQICGQITVGAPLQWLSELAGDVSPVLAVRALRTLARKNTTASIARVARALREHPTWAVRAQAAAMLGSRRGDDARDWLIEALTVEAEPRVRVAITEALGEFREEVVASVLLRTLAQSQGKTWHEIAQLLVSLARTRDPRALRTIEPYLQVDSWSDLLRSKAAVALGHLQDEAALPVLLEASRRGSERCLAGVATGLGTLADAVPEVRRQARERLEELVTSHYLRVRLASLGALATVCDPASLPVLERLHRSAPDGRVRRMAWEAIHTVRAGRTSEDGLVALRERLDRLAHENGRLRERVDHLERPGATWSANDS